MYRLRRRDERAKRDPRSDWDSADCAWSAPAPEPLSKGGTA